MALVKCPCAFRLRRLARNGGCGRGVRHVSDRFPHKMVLVTCPCAFRVRRLAQKARFMSGARHFSCKFSHQMALLIHKSCQLQGTFTDILPRDLSEILYRDLARRPLMEILYRDLVQRAEVLIRDPVIEILCRRHSVNTSPTSCVHTSLSPVPILLRLLKAHCLESR